MSKYLIIFQSTLLAIVMPGALTRAGTFDSNGSGGGNWSSASTWTLTGGSDTGTSGIPDDDENANVLSGDTVTRDNGDLLAGSGSTFTVNGTGVLNMGANQLDLDAGSVTLQVNGTSQLNSSERIISGSNSEVELNGGTLTLSGTDRAFESTSNSSTWDINSGTVNVLSFNTAARPALDLQGTWNQSGGTVTLNNAGGRAIEVSGFFETSVLNLSGTASLTAQGIEVSDVASDLGTSTISIEGSNVVKVDFDHFYMVDNAYDNQLGALDFSFDNNGVTEIDLGNNTPFQGAGGITGFADFYQFNIDAVVDADYLALTQYTLLDFSGGSFDPSASLQGVLDFSGAGQFATVTDATDGANFTFQSGGSLQTIYYANIRFDSSRVYLDVYRSTAVPEPSSVLLLGLGAAMLWRRVRNRLAEQ